MQTVEIFHHGCGVWSLTDSHGDEQEMMESCSSSNENELRDFVREFYPNATHITMVQYIDPRKGDEVSRLTISMRYETNNMVVSPTRVGWFVSSMS